MTKSREDWTTLDLELFHDEQLDAHRALKLSDELRYDASLRTRLAQVRRVDEAVRTSLLHPYEARAFPTWPGLRGSLAVFSLLLVVTTVGWVSFSRTTSESRAPIRLAQDTTHRSVRVVFSVPVSPGRKPAGPDPASVNASTPGSDEKIFLSRLSGALAAGRVEEALDLLASTPTDRRRVGYRHLGELLQSAQLAELILDRLSPDEQLAVCGDWASEPAMRPIVFARLRRLFDEPSMTHQVHAILAQLSTDPALRAWLHGYQLFHDS